MPRTKQIKKKKQETENLQDVVPRLKSDNKQLTEEKNKSIEEIKLSKRKVQCFLERMLKEELLLIPNKFKNATVEDIISGVTLQNSTMLSRTINNTTHEKSSAKPKGKLKRASSFQEDDGYLTAESSNASTGGRKSRSKNTTTVKKKTRRTRSLSKTKLDAYKTPASFKSPPDSYGIVTPKVKPNTPQIILRRPNIGEMALSLQGSPLFTGAPALETVPNINIPLNDGRLFTLQPQRGLRMSQVPQLDAATREQLEALRDNLNKLCG